MQNLNKRYIPEAAREASLNLLKVTLLKSQKSSQDKYKMRNETPQQLLPKT